MALLAFHWSSPYKEKLLSGEISGTVMPGCRSFPIGDEVLAYISAKPNLLDGKIDSRIGKLKIKEVRVVRVRELKDRAAKACGCQSLGELKDALEKWYRIGENDIATFVGFDLEIEK